MIEATLAARARRAPRLLDDRLAPALPVAAVRGETRNSLGLSATGSCEQLAGPSEYGSGMSSDHVRLNRASWDEDAPNWVERGRKAWSRKDPIWGRGNLESELRLLPEVAGLDAIDLGCGTAYISAWL